jgi:hypothetical protein
VAEIQERDRFVERVLEALARWGYLPSASPSP